MNRIHTKLRIILSVLLGLCLFLSIFFSILKPPIRGIADQGDFERMMTWIGAEYQNNEYYSKYFHWVNRLYSLGPAKRGEVISSEIILLHGARFIHTLLQRTTFDLQIFGILQTVLFCLALSLTAFYVLSLHSAIGFLFIPFALFVFTDIGYTAYFNSFYQESSGIIFLFFVLVVILKTLHDGKTKNNKSNLILFTLASILLISAKAQYFILFFPILCTQGMLFSSVQTKKMLVSIGILVTAFSVTFYLWGTPKIMKEWNAYNSVFPQILGNTNNTERAMRILAIDPQFLKYAGIYASEKNSGINDAALKPLLTLNVFPRVMLYYIRTPNEFVSLSKEIEKRSFEPLIRYLGYYEKGNGHIPTKQPTSSTHWYNLKHSIISRYHLFVLPFIFSMCLVSLYQCMHKRNMRYVPVFFVACSAITQFFIIAFSEGVSGSIEKLLFLFNVCFDLLLFMFVCMVIKQILYLFQTKKR